MTHRITLLTLVLCLVPAAGLGEEVLREISWADLDAAGTLGQGRVAPAGECGPYECFVVTNDIATKTTVLALVINTTALVLLKKRAGGCR